MNSSALSPVTPLSYVSDVSSHETLPSGLAMKPSRLETMCAVTLGVFVVIYLSPYDYPNMGSPNTGHNRPRAEHWWNHARLNRAAPVHAFDRRGHLL
jgi:hypothetical protein